MDMFRYGASIFKGVTLCHGRGYYQRLQVAQGMPTLGGFRGYR